MPAVPAQTPPDEATRLAALHELQVLDTLPEAVYDDIVRLASQICGTPIGLVSLVDSERQCFKAHLGLAARETHRDLAFCAHAIVADEPVFVVEETALDARFRTNPLVTGDPHIRFYAGAPIVMSDGQPLGTVCVIDTVPRVLDDAQLLALQALSRQTTALLELRLRTLASERATRELARVSAQAADERQRSAALLELSEQRLSLALSRPGGGAGADRQPAAPAHRHRSPAGADRPHRHRAALPLSERPHPARLRHRCPGVDRPDDARDPRRGHLRATRAACRGGVAGRADHVHLHRTGRRAHGPLSVELHPRCRRCRSCPRFLCDDLRHHRTTRNPTAARNAGAGRHADRPAEPAPVRRAHRRGCCASAARSRRWR